MYLVCIVETPPKLEALHSPSGDSLILNSPPEAPSDQGRMLQDYECLPGGPELEVSVAILGPPAPGRVCIYMCIYIYTYIDIYIYTHTMCICIYNIIQMYYIT